MQRVHLDTDFGGDPDDACALALLLGWPGVELMGITTTIDPDGHRAAYARYCLELAGHTDIPVVSGAAVSLTTRQVADPFLNDDRYWPTNLEVRQSAPGAALDLLQANIKRGAAVITIGPQTNLALLELVRPGALAGVPITMMGGWTALPAPDLPAWGPEMDFNVQWDSQAAEIVATTAALTLTTMAATLRAPLRMQDLPRLRAAGPLGSLLARQSEVYGAESGKTELGASYPGLPDDLVNFHWDPVTCAVAPGWDGATIVEMCLTPTLENEILHFESDPHGRSMRIVIDVDGEQFTDLWLSAVEAIHS